MKTKSSINYINKIFKILNSREKKKLITLFLFIIVTFVLEMMSISLVVPIVTLIFDDNFATNINSFKFVPYYIKVLTPNEILKLCLIGILVIYFIKTI